MFVPTRDQVLARGTIFNPERKVCLDTKSTKVPEMKPGL